MSGKTGERGNEETGDLWLENQGAPDIWLPGRQELYAPIPIVHIYRIWRIS
jgi:hypothetical protein